MAALAVDQPGLHRQIDQISIDRDDVSLDFAKPKIDFGQCMFAAPLTSTMRASSTHAAGTRRTGLATSALSSLAACGSLRRIATMAEVSITVSWEFHSRRSR
jgi:hypothetical protein